MGRLRGEYTWQQVNWVASSGLLFVANTPARSLIDVVQAIMVVLYDGVKIYWIRWKNGRKRGAGVVCFLGLRLDGAGQRSRTKTCIESCLAIQAVDRCWRMLGGLCTITGKQPFSLKNKNSKHPNKLWKFIFRINKQKWYIFHFNLFCFWNDYDLVNIIFVLK